MSEWIDISVPHGTTNSPPGTYTGTISITADQGSATIPVTLTVWNFELPAQPSELSLWTLWPPATGNTTATLAKALMRNKVMGWYDVAANSSSDSSSSPATSVPLNELRGPRLPMPCCTDSAWTGNHCSTNVQWIPPW